jgi:dimethylamine/trimethylamine dehydrogenase
MADGKSGYEVVLIEAGRELGGRIGRESRLPGLAAWRRVLDYRSTQIDRLPNVEVYFESAMTAAEVLEYGFRHIAVATGAIWRNDGVGHDHVVPMEIDPAMRVLTPDDIMGGARPGDGRVVLYDDDHYYLGSVLAELLVDAGHRVTLVTPASEVSQWTHNTLEQHRIQARLLDKGVSVVPHRSVRAITASSAVTRCVFTGREVEIPADTVVLITSRLPNEQLALDLFELHDEWEQAGLSTVRAVGDALSPGTIAAAVWDGRRFAEELDSPNDAALFRRNVPSLG